MSPPHNPPKASKK
jgi:hypothetical protein